MAFRRADSVSTRCVGLVAVLLFAGAAMAAERQSKLAGEAAAAERILVAIPELKGVAAGKTIDIAP